MLVVVGEECLLMYSAGMMNLEFLCMVRFLTSSVASSFLSSKSFEQSFSPT